MEQESAQLPSDGETRQVLVVGPDGRPLGTMAIEGPPEDDSAEDPTRMVEQPAKVMRIGSMIKQLLEEVRVAPLDEAGRIRLKEIYERAVVELEQGISPQLRDELARLFRPFAKDSTPSEAELRIAQAQLVGWLEGLIQGIHATLVAQQVASKLELEQIRAGRPALPVSPAGLGGQINNAVPGEGHTGQYL